MVKVYCPKCGSCNIVDSLGGEGLEERNDGIKPRYYCNDCNQSFGVLEGESTYPEIVKSIAFDIKGFFTNSVSLKAQWHKNKITYSIESKKDNINFNGLLSDEEWKEITKKLFDICFLDSWKNVYYSTRLVDGTTWFIEVKLQRKHALQYHGCNGFPPYWNEFLTILEPVFAKVGVTIDEFRNSKN